MRVSGRIVVPVVVVLTLFCGCYTRRHIIVPPTEHGAFCMKDADMSRQLCMIQQRGIAFCDRRKDDELLRCEGAYELTAATAPDGGQEGETPTYQLPGYR